MREGDFELVTLRSGARAVRHLGHGEIMHPAGGPWEEANRLYIEQSRLTERLQQAAGRPVGIFDIGLGAATNAVAALRCARAAGGRIALHSFEIDLAPLRLALREPASFPFLSEYQAAAQALCEHGTWSGPEGQWILHLGDALTCLAQAPQVAELVFFDPFSPRHNAALWTPGAFAAVRACCRGAVVRPLRLHAQNSPRAQNSPHAPPGSSDPDADGSDSGALLFTYSAATPMRAALLVAGFYVGVGVGTGSKRETTVAATRLSDLAAPLSARWLARWERSTARAPIGETLLTAEREREIRSHPQFQALS